MKYFQIQRVIPDENAEPPKSRHSTASFRVALNDAYENLITCFSGRLTKIMIVMLYINFSIQFGYFKNAFNLLSIS